MYCIRCGKKLEDGVKYCIRCGAPVKDQKRARTDVPAEMGQQEDDFTIRIPQDYIQAEAAQNIQHVMEQAAVPDEAGDDSFTRAMAREEIREAMAQSTAEAQPDEAGDDSFTRAMAREEIREAMAQSTAEAQPDEAGDDSFTRAMAREEIREAMAQGAAEAQPDEAGEEDYTRMVAKDEIHAALAEQQEQQTEAEEVPPLDVDEIPDIPIPSDFVAQEAPRYYTPPAPYVPAEHTVHRLEQEEEEPLMSGRSLLFVALIVIAFFAIAVGAFVLALNSTGTTDTGSGSGSAEVGFWSADAKE
ncbi:MAG: zinc ribbon domain-containing protein [Eubacteriales bacterium]|nr:zinc ribbon domain-containing protein [Eubacteriales bacterium]